MSPEKIQDFWPTLALQWEWALNSNFCSWQRGFEFTGQCTEAEDMWSSKGPYIVPRQTLKGVFVNEDLFYIISHLFTVSQSFIATWFLTGLLFILLIKFLIILYVCFSYIISHLFTISHHSLLHDLELGSCLYFS